MKSCPKGMAAQHTFQFLAGPALQDFDLLEAGFFSYGSDPFFSHQYSAGFGIYQRIGKLRMQGNGLIGRQRPGRCSPDKHIGRLVRGNLALAVGYRKLHVDGVEVWS